MTTIKAQISVPKASTAGDAGAGNQGIWAGRDGKGCHRPDIGPGRITDPETPIVIGHDRLHPPGHHDHYHPLPYPFPHPLPHPCPPKLTPRHEDKSAGQAIDELNKAPAPISGEALERAILKGTADLDNQAAGAEYRDFKKFAEQNWDKLSPDAKAKWRVYQGAALKAQSQGRTGIPVRDWQKMAGDMHRAHGCHDHGYRDASARQALSKLDNQPGRVTADDFLQAFRAGTADNDGQVFGREFADFARFADKNWHRMTPGARSAFRAYQHTASDARWFGKTGANASEYGALTQQMKQAAAWANQLFAPQLLRI